MNLSISDYLLSQGSPEEAQAVALLIAFASVIPRNMAVDDHKVNAIYKLGDALRRNSFNYVYTDVVSTACEAEKSLHRELQSGPDNCIGWSRAHSPEVQCAINTVLEHRCCQYVADIVKGLRKQ